MTLRFSGVYADAGAMWRANRDLLLTLAGIFFFLPVFAFELFVPIPSLEGVEGDALIRAVTNWYVANGLWLLLSLLVQFFGGAVILKLLLDPARPTVAQALGAVLRIVPALLVAMLGSALLIGGGSLLFFFPGMYAFGRCYLVWAVIVAEPEHGPVNGFIEGLVRTHGLGWRLFALGMTVVIPFYLVSQILGGLVAGLGSSGIIGTAVIALCGGTLSAAAGIGQLLLQAGAYRALKQGI